MTQKPENNPAGTTRRDFLSKTVMVAGAATALAACADAKPPVVMPIGPARSRTPLGEGETIRMGLIGCGGMGSGHLRATMAQAENGLENVQIVAVCDVCKKKVESNAKACSDRQGNQVDTHRYYPELLEREDIHAVLIASPEHWHAQMAIDAIHAGKDVYLEKPMTLRFPEAVALRDVVNSHDQMFQVGTQKIALPRYVEAMRLLGEGAVGHPTMSQTSYCRNSKTGEWTYYHIDPEIVPGEQLDWDAWCGPLGKAPWDPAIYARWRRYRKYSTGIVGDLLVHQITPLLMSLDAGWPVRVTATGGHYIDKEMENHDQVNITIQFEKDHTMIVAGSTCNEVGLETIVRGHKGNMYLGGSNVVIKPERIYVDDVEEQVVECDFFNDQDALRLNWFKSIRTRKPPISNVELGLKVMAVVDMATRSMWEGSAFGLDTKTMKLVKL
jgi:predicted dehydrogenase